MPSTSLLTPAILAAALLSLLPMLGAAFLPERFAAAAQRMPPAARFAAPALLCLPYALVALTAGGFRWHWFVLYALLPVAIALLMHTARIVDPGQRGNWRDFLLLAALGLAVDLRLFEPAWPQGLAALGKMLLVDAGLYAFLSVRQLGDVGFDLRLRLGDIRIGLREFSIYAPVAIALGLSLGFLHVHAGWPSPLRAVAAYLFTFFFIAVPEELFFRGWLQNLLERRVGSRAALLVTALLFGLAHWNKHTAGFNWRYVLLAALAGIFYGRAWRAERRVAASAVTHATVDTVWSLWLR